MGARRASGGQLLRTSSHVIRGSAFSFATLINRFTASFITLTATFFFVAFFNSAHAVLTSVTFVATSATVFAHKSCSFALLRTYILFSSYTRRWPVLCPATAFQPRRCHTQHLYSCLDVIFLCTAGEVLPSRSTHVLRPPFGRQRLCHTTFRIFPTLQCGEARGDLVVLF